MVATFDDKLFDDSLSSRRSLKRFPPEVESAYRAYSSERNSKHVKYTAISALFIDLLFLVSDYMAARDYFTAFVIGRLLIVSPVCLLVSFMVLYKHPLYNAASNAIPVTVSAVLCYLIATTTGEYREHYLFGTVLSMVVCCVLSRPRLLHASLSILVQFICYAAVLTKMDMISDLSKPVYLLYWLTAAFVSLVTVSALESFDRDSFVLGLRVTRLNKQLEAQSLTDHLTGLSNRRSFENAIARHWSEEASRTQPMSFVLLDVDLFKLFNDTYGHSAGDRCLIEVAACVTAEIPKDRGLAVRFGGEEVLLVLPATPFDQARAIAERVRQRILKAAIPHSANGLGVISASFGVATACPAACEAAELVIRADTALYAAKRNGRNTVWPPLGDAGSEPTRSSELVQSAA